MGGSQSIKAGTRDSIGSNILQAVLENNATNVRKLLIRHRDELFREIDSCKVAEGSIEYTKSSFDDTRNTLLGNHSGSKGLSCDQIPPEQRLLSSAGSSRNANKTYVLIDPNSAAALDIVISEDNDQIIMLFVLMMGTNGVIPPVLHKRDYFKRLKGGNFNQLHDPCINLLWDVSSAEFNNKYDPSYMKYYSNDMCKTKVSKISDSITLMPSISTPECEYIYIREQFETRPLTIFEKVILCNSKKSISQLIQLEKDLGIGLVAACWKGSDEIVERLLSNGAHPNYIRYGISPIHAAMLSDVARVEKIRILFKYGVDSDCTTPIMRRQVLANAACRNDYEVVQVLLESGVNPNKLRKDGFLPTALFESVYWGNTDIVKLLLKYNASLEIRNNQNQTVLDLVSIVASLADSRQSYPKPDIAVPKVSLKTFVLIKNILIQHLKKKTPSTKIRVNKLPWESVVRDCPSRNEDSGLFMYTNYFHTNPTPNGVGPLVNDEINFGQTFYFDSNNVMDTPTSEYSFAIRPDAKCIKLIQNEQRNIKNVVKHTGERQNPQISQVHNKSFHNITTISDPSGAQNKYRSHALTNKGDSQRELNSTRIKEQRLENPPFSNTYPRKGFRRSTASSFPGSQSSLSIKINSSAIPNSSINFNQKHQLDNVNNTVLKSYFLKNITNQRYSHADSLKDLPNFPDYRINPTGKRGTHEGTANSTNSNSTDNIPFDKEECTYTGMSIDSEKNVVGEAEISDPIDFDGQKNIFVFCPI